MKPALSGASGFIGWMMDVAREQSPSEARLREILRRSQAAGYNAVGLYLEHRFAYPSATFARGEGCLTGEVIKRLQQEFASSGLRLIPFLNTLGHMEGFVRARGGEWLAEGPAQDLEQICPSRQECVRFARGLVDDAIEAFSDEWLHLGGDETWQLGQCPQCAQRVEQIGRGGLYAEYFVPLCRYVLDRGRRPCLWGDMLLQHSDALEALPRETVIFDWHYNTRPAPSTKLFRERGFDVVCCPAVHTFDAPWCYLDRTEENIDGHVADAGQTGALGVLVTTWEFMHLSACEAILPLVYAAGRRITRNEAWNEAIVAEADLSYLRGAEILGLRMPAASRYLGRSGRDRFRVAFVGRLDPFELWCIWREEARGPVGDELLRLCDEADAALPQASVLRFPLAVHRAALEWVRGVEATHNAYLEQGPRRAVPVLRSARAALELLRPHVERTAQTGGSRADVYRLRRTLARVDEVLSRLAALGGPSDDPQGASDRCLPSFQTLIAPGWTPHDQAAWRSP